ncbi:RmlC-like cupin domain-containing protein [Melanogaster broomeanus]|nr:RmlC-like cupin domain-containing protein [Melanogaster broomeanus]
MSDQVFLLAPAIKTYSWGKNGDTSLVAQLAAATPGFHVDESLWMGTHPAAPSRVLSSGKLLSEHLAANPHLVGEPVINRFGLKNGDLPFLFKVLSFDKALPVQIHPDKKLAERIHASKPDRYADPNHKPEMALALSQFHALCGFVAGFQVSTYLSAVPEFASMFSQDLIHTEQDVDRQKEVLKELLSILLKADKAYVEQKLHALIDRYQEKMKALILRLHEMYPGDHGIFCAFLVNYYVLNEGDALSVAEGEPHAYISGDIIECMATSDNTIPAAFTPQEDKDIENFLSGVQVSPTTGKTLIQPTMFTPGSTHTSGTLMFNPGINELAVMTVIVAKLHTETHRTVRGPSIAVVTDGEGTIVWADGSKRLYLTRGQVVFIGQGTVVKFSARERPLHLYRAFVEAPLD